MEKLILKDKTEITINGMTANTVTLSRSTANPSVSYETGVLATVLYIE